MTPARRRNTFLLGLVVLAAVLVGGRWLALETAERDWGASIARGVRFSRREPPPVVTYGPSRDRSRVILFALSVACVSIALKLPLLAYGLPAEFNADEPTILKDPFSNSATSKMRSVLFFPVETPICRGHP